jgi:sortase A
MAKFIRLVIKKFPLGLILIIISLMIFVNNSFNLPKQKNETQLAVTAVTDPDSISYRLRIEQIGVDSPIVLNVDGADKKTYFDSLEKGVAHMKGSTPPGDEGNIVIFGHSSKPDGYKGEYGEAFAKLNDLEIGDSIKIINTKTKDELNFSVIEKKIIQESDLSVIQPTQRALLTILTCWPIETHEKRLLIIAE